MSSSSTSTRVRVGGVASRRRLGKMGSLVFAWFIRGISGFRTIGQWGCGLRTATAGVRKVRCVGRGVPGHWLTRVLWESVVWMGVELFHLGRWLRLLLLEEDARVNSSARRWL